jgi:hypothetical protein
MDRGMIRTAGPAGALASGLLLSLAACGGGEDRPATATPLPDTVSDWRRIASPADRDRLRRWRTAWTVSLAAAMRTPGGAAAIAADPALFDPDRVLATALPPAGAYRCRTIKLGRRGSGGAGYVAYDWFRCGVGPGPAPVTFAKVDGSQRQSGLLYEDTDARAVFLGALALGDEARVMDYGRDRRRNVAGLVERIGPRRWRIVFPYPAFESTLDVLEVQPS